MEKNLGFDIEADEISNLIEHKKSDKICNALESLGTKDSPLRIIYKTSGRGLNPRPGTYGDSCFYGTSVGDIRFFICNKDQIGWVLFIRNSHFKKYRKLTEKHKRTTIMSVYLNHVYGLDIKYINRVLDKDMISKEKTIKSDTFYKIRTFFSEIYKTIRRF